MPFLRNVTRGRGIPRGAAGRGRRALPALRRRLADQRAATATCSPRSTPTSPRTASTCRSTGATATGTRMSTTRWRQMRDDGVTRALVFATSATASYSSCRQYREDMARARAAAGERRAGDGQAAALLRPSRASSRPTPTASGRRWPSLPADAATAPAWSSPRTRSRCRWTTPRAARRRALHARSCARRPAGRRGRRGPGAAFDLVWQSRSGPPQVPWLEPDINDHLGTRSPTGAYALRSWCQPIGFVSDHLEVLWDLDNEAAADRGEARPGLRPRGDRRHRPALRQDGPRAGRGADARRAQARAGTDGLRATTLPAGLLPGSAPDRKSTRTSEVTGLIGGGTEPRCRRPGGPRRTAVQVGGAASSRARASATVMAPPGASARARSSTASQPFGAGDQRDRPAVVSGRQLGGDPAALLASSSATSGRQLAASSAASADAASGCRRSARCSASGTVSGSGAGSATSYASQHRRGGALLGPWSVTRGTSPRPRPTTASPTASAAVVNGPGRAARAGRRPPAVPPARPPATARAHRQRPAQRRLAVRPGNPSPGAARRRR